MGVLRKKKLIEPSLPEKEHFHKINHFKLHIKIQNTSVTNIVLISIIIKKTFLNKIQAIL